MTCISRTNSKRRLSARLAAGLGISAFLVLGTFVAAASADDHRGGDRRAADHRGGDRGRGGPDRGYYAPPPVVYAPPSPYYAPPPVVVYAPGIGVTIGIQ